MEIGLCLWLGAYVAVLMTCWMVVVSEMSPTLASHISYLDFCSNIGMREDTACVLYYILICFALMGW